MKVLFFILIGFSLFLFLLGNKAYAYSCYCPAKGTNPSPGCDTYGMASDSNYLDQGACNLNCCGLYYAGGGQLTCTSDACVPYPPQVAPYDCGYGTAVSSYCSNTLCSTGYQYQDLYSCDPSMWSGCCTQCPAAQTCNSGTVGAYIPDGNCGYQYCPATCNATASCGSWSTCSGAPTNTCYSGNGSRSRTCKYTTYNGSTNCIQPTFTQTQSCTYDNCYAPGTGSPYACYGGACETHIYAWVYTDYNHDQTVNGNDAGRNGVNITDNNWTNTYQTGYNGSTGEMIFTTTSGSYAVQIQTPSNFATENGTSHSISLTSTSGNITTKFYVTPLYSMGGTVYNDLNHDGKYNGTDTAYASGTVTISGGPTTVSPITVAANGLWQTPTNLLAGTYTVTYSASSLPSGYTMTTASSWTVTVGDPAGSPVCATGGSPDALCGGTNNGSISRLNFGVDQPYQISGTVFNDVNKDTKLDNGETGFTSGSKITLTGPTSMTVSADASGNYTTGQVLLPGTYTVQYNTSLTPLPGGYMFTTPSTFTVVVGYNPVCSTGGSPDAVCTTPNTSSIANLNFGVTNEQVYNNSVCLDIRGDTNGTTTTDPLPAPGATCGGVNSSQAVVNNGSCSTGSGIVMSCTGTFDFGLGTSSSSNLTTGGTSPNADCYSGGGLNVIPTSYDYLLTTAQESNITPTNLDNTVNADPATSCNVADCILPATLPKGIYQVNGNLTLDAASYTFPAPADPTTTSQSYIILVNGDLHINGNIYLPLGSVAVFSVSGNIYVSPNVGNTITSTASTSVNNPDLEGVYSSDHSFYVLSYGSGTNICNADGTPIDKRLVILGSVITNASQTGGSFVNERDMCIYDTSCSTVQTGDGINGTDQGTLFTYLLDLIADGKFLSNKNFNWQEVRP